MCQKQATLMMSLRVSLLSFVLKIHAMYVMQFDSINTQLNFCF